MLVSLFVVFCFGNVVVVTQGSSHPRCAVVIFLNQSSFKSDSDFSAYLQNIQGLTANSSSVYFSDDPDSFVVKHGKFIDAPGLFALESKRYPGKFLRRANHTVVLEGVEQSETFKNDATFLMDHADRNESYTTLKLFSHRSWKLSSFPNPGYNLLFDTPKDHVASNRGLDLLVVAQPCRNYDTEHRQASNTSIPKADIEAGHNKATSVSGADDPSLTFTSSPQVNSDPTLNRKTDTKYLTAVTNKGKLNTIANEYSFENYKVPDFIMHSLLEDDKSAGDGMEAPKPEPKPSANIVTDSEQRPHLQTLEHETKLPTAKQKISEMSGLIHDPDTEDIASSLKDLQYGSRGCKLLVAEDTAEEDPASKDTVTHPQKNKGCMDEFPDSCQEMAKKGYCLAFKSLMSSVCRRSCNLCSSLVDTGFTSCTKSCGSGRQMRMIKIHRREYLQTRRCNTQPCPIDGGYTEFGHFTECSVTCGRGVKYRRRTCTNPRPQFNGRSCRRLGPSIESKDCDAGPCPRSRKKDHHDKPEEKKKTHKDIQHQKTELHIDGPHSDKAHEHLILLKGKRVAKLSCMPRNGQLRSIVQDAVTKRFTVHPSKDGHNSKKSKVEEGDIVYNHEGLPVDTTSTVVKAFKSPYKIILSRKGENKMKLLEECLETDNGLDEGHDSTVDEDKSLSYGDEPSSEPETDLSDANAATEAKQKRKHKGSDQVFTRPGEKSFKDFDEYQYETGNVVTPQVTTSPDEDDRGYSTPTGKSLDEENGLDFFLDKINAAKPKIDDQLSDEEDLESSFKMENQNPVGALTFNSEESEREGDDADSAGRAGFTVTTAPDSNPVNSRDNSDNDDDSDSNGYRVESVADR